MMGRVRVRRLLSVSAVACVALAVPMSFGCGTQRLAQQRAWLEMNPSAPTPVKQAVLGKKLIPGMDEDAIVASWGKPNQILKLGSGGDARWTYIRPQNRDGSRVSVEYNLVLNGGVLIAIHHHNRL
jgi:hypothetical protein